MDFLIYVPPGESRVRVPRAIERIITVRTKSGTTMRETGLPLRGGWRYRWPGCGEIRFAPDSRPRLLRASVEGLEGGRWGARFIREYNNALTSAFNQLRKE